MSRRYKAPKITYNNESGRVYSIESIAHNLLNKNFDLYEVFKKNNKNNNTDFLIYFRRRFNNLMTLLSISDLKILFVRIL